MTSPVLEFDAARIAFRTRASDRVVIPDLSLSLQPGEALGLVGESYCGKSTLAYAAMGYLGPTGHVPAGEIRIEGRDIASLSERELRALRGDRMAMVYQDPMSSLNPVMRIGKQVMEVPLRHHRLTLETARQRAISILHEVELSDPEALMERYPTSSPAVSSSGSSSPWRSLPY